MALNFTQGMEVRQVLPPPVQGTIKDIRIVDGAVSYLVEYFDANAEPHQRWFMEDELTGVAV